MAAYDTVDELDLAGGAHNVWSFTWLYRIRSIDIGPVSPKTCLGELGGFGRTTLLALHAAGFWDVIFRFIWPTQGVHWLDLPVLLIGLFWAIVIPAEFRFRRHRPSARHLRCFRSLVLSWFGNFTALVMLMTFTIGMMLGFVAAIVAFGKGIGWLFLYLVGLVGLG